MLQKLSIQNYAIIEELEIEFSAKMNVITGETGAGKSIIVGALGLILGERADTSLLVKKEKKCIVEGVFTSSKKQVKNFLKENELDHEDELVIRREIGTNGKSRGFVNDSPVSLLQLQELSSLLVDLHQQFDTLSLNESDFQREVLDALAGHGILVDEYRSNYDNWQRIKKELDLLRDQKLQFDKEADYHQFQFNELAEAGFTENELEEIDAGLKLMNNAEAIKASLDKAVYKLSESETPLVQQLKSVIQSLQGYVSFHPGLPALFERLKSAQIELQDLASELESISNEVNYDPKKAELLSERLSLGYKLQKKHGVSSTGELLNIQQQLEEKLKTVLDMDELIDQKEKETNNLLQEANQLANRISEGRNKQIKTLEEKVNKLLIKVGMPNARLKVEIKTGELDRNGIDRIEFLFNANLPAGESGKPGQFQPLRKIASGGELSRLMLCIKSLVAESIDLPTLIFDEIDTGISGEAARQVGNIMKGLSAKRQLISITHQPQIAGKADAHFFVFKEIVNNNVITSIRQLNLEERITTIAKMLSGEKPTAAALENAREMVGN